MPDLTDIESVKNYIGNFGANTDADETLRVFIREASDAVRMETSDNWDLRSYTDQRNGNGSRAMRALHWPILGNPLPTVTENGTSLTVALGFSETADVSVDIETGVFYRLNGPTSITNPLRWTVPATWSRGILNVVLGYTSGGVPSDIVLVTQYIVARLWKEADKKEIGIATRATGQVNITFMDDLPKRFDRILKNRRRVFLPER